MSDGMMSGPEPKSIKANPIGCRDVPHQLEEWFVNDAYCMKRITIRPGMQSSLHHHPSKSECFVVVSGELVILKGKDSLPDHVGHLEDELFFPGDVIVIPKGTLHRWKNISDEDAVVIEASSHHEDDDAVKWESSGPI